MNETQQPTGEAPLAGILADMVAYQPGSIVSRVILKAGTGNVTLFAFDRGQGLSEHTAPFAALVQVLDGAAEITIGGAPHHVATGGMILMPANVPHALDARERFKMALTMIRA
jgi:quercetin dioxygenase-like cupin family protein